MKNLLLLAVLLVEAEPPRLIDIGGEKWQWCPPHQADDKHWPAGWYRWDKEERKWGLLGYGWHNGLQEPRTVDVPEVR